jgi:hypothetical protein
MWIKTKAIIPYFAIVFHLPEDDSVTPEDVQNYNRIREGEAPAEP